MPLRLRAWRGSASFSRIRHYSYSYSAAALAAALSYRRQTVAGWRSAVQGAQVQELARAARALRHGAAQHRVGRRTRAWVSCTRHRIRMMTVAQHTTAERYLREYSPIGHSCRWDGSAANERTTVARRYEGKPEDYAVSVDDQPPVRLQDLRLRLCSAAYTEHRTVPYRRGMAWHGMARHGMARDGYGMPNSGGAR